MCLGDFHARILRWIVQDNVVVIWNFLFVLAVECDAAVFISPRFLAVITISRVLKLVHSHRRYGSVGARFGLDGDRLISLHLDVEEARPRDTAVLILRVDGDGLHLSHALHVEVVVGRYQGKRRGRNQKRAEKDDRRRHGPGRNDEDGCHLRRLSLGGVGSRRPALLISGGERKASRLNSSGTSR